MWNRRRGLVALAVIVVLVALSVAVWPFLRNLGRGPGCTIAAVGTRLSMPDHAVTIALAAALQESNLYNLPDGDRDSAGLFQQRPSQGWGTPAHSEARGWSISSWLVAHAPHLGVDR